MRTLGVVVLLASLAGAARAETMHGATCHTLFRFDSATPGTSDWSISIPGSWNEECLDGLDFDPRSGVLYGHSHFDCFIACGPEYSTQMFIIDPESAAVTTFWGDNGLSGFFRAVFDIDVMPATGEIRMIGNAGGFNLRLSPLTASVEFDTSLIPSRRIGGVAHSPNSVHAAGTETYAIAYTGEFAMPLDLVRIGGPGGDPPASSGELSVIGTLGVDVEFVTGFDISPSGTAYMAAIHSRPGVSRDRGRGWGDLPVHLYTIDLATGAATDLGEIASPDGSYVSAIAAAVPRGAVEIPALGQAAQALLAALLALSGAWILFRRRERAA